MPESPMWLLRKNKYRKAVDAFNRMAALNLSKNRIESNALIYIE